jgi:predicted metal-dependent peptidase
MEQPFFATLLLKTPVVITEDIPLAATDMKNIYFNPNFLDTLDIGGVMTVCAHEVGHNALLHSARKEGRNHELWNMAGDHAINLMLIDQGFSCPSSVGGGWLADPKYKGWSAERIYDDLRQEQQAQQKKPGKGKGGKGSGDPGSGEGGKRDWLHGDLLPTPSQNAAEEAETVRRMKQNVAQAANAARLAGKLKGDLAQLVDEFLNPKVPWSDLLRDYLMRVVKDDESWSRRSRRFGHVYLPARHSERMGPIVIIGDSSGSIWCSPDELKTFATEIQSVADMVQPEHIRLIWADTEVASEEVFEQGQPLKFEVKGGGGTDMRVPLKHVEQYNPEVVILLTDGYSPFDPIDPPYPLIVCCSTEAPIPVGQVIRI